MSLFGAAKPGGLFGSAAPAPAFGAPTKPLFGSTSQASTGNLFGTTTLASTGGGLFGTTATTSAGGLFGAPAAKTAAPPTFNFNAPKTTGGLFGAPVATSAFSFANPTVSAAKPSLFSFGQTATTAPSGGLFGAPAAAAVPAVPQPPPSYGPAEELARLVHSVTTPLVYGDERDAVVAKLNQIQAGFGTGKGAFAQGQPPVEYGLENPYCRFKAVCYNRMPGHRNEEGLVGLVIRQPSETIRSRLQELKDGLNRILGGSAALHVEVEAVKPMPNSSSEVVLYVAETGATGLRRRIPASDLAAHLSAGALPSQLSSQLGVVGLAAKGGLDSAQLADFLRGPPPAGIAAVLWAAAMADNPDPAALVPWPVLGFAQLAERQRAQRLEATAQKDYAGAMAMRVRAAEGTAADLGERLGRLRLRQATLAHRLLGVVAAEALAQRSGQTFSADEEEMRGRLELLHARLNGPHGFKGRLGELLSVLRSQPQLLRPAPDTDAKAATLEPTQLTEISDFLEDFQEGLDKLSTSLKCDETDLKTAEKILVSAKRI